MELMSDQEVRTRKAYRWTFAIALAVVVAISLWLALPPSRVDMRFLSVLHPKRTEGERGYRSFTYGQLQSEIEKVLDAHLNANTHWKKTTTGVYTTYTRSGRGMLTLTVTPEYGPTTTAPVGSGPSVAIVQGTTLTIEDPRGVAILP